MEYLACIMDMYVLEHCLIELINRADPLFVFYSVLSIRDIDGDPTRCSSTLANTVRPLFLTGS